MTYNRIQDVRDRLDLSEEIIRDEEIQQEMERANRTMKAKVGRYVVERFIVTDTDENTINLKHSEIISVEKIRKNGDDVSSSNYSVNTSTGVITFTSDETFYYRDVVEVYYIPRIFADLELLYTELFLLTHRNILTDSDVKQARIDQIKELIKETIQTINQSGTILTYVDRYKDVNSIW